MKAALDVAQPERASAGLAPRGATAWIDGLVVVLAVAAVVAAGALRFFISDGQPLWLDETWTGAIATQRGFSQFWRQVYLDVNAPLYYLFMHGWQALFGASDKALRLPSAIFGAAAPVLIALAPSTGLARPGRLTWAALLALWIPGVWLGGEARGYTLLALISVAAMLAYLRLLRAPSTARATVWAGLSALAILTHYHALLLAALQGLGYLAYRRERALRTWPAALAFLPAFAWLAWHAPRIAAFMQPGVAWYPLLKVRGFDLVAAYPFGTVTVMIGSAVILAAAAGLAMAAARLARSSGGARAYPDTALWLAVAAAVAGAVAVTALGFVRPSFTTRYLVPFVPGILLGLVLVAARAGRTGGVAMAALIGLFAWGTATWAVAEFDDGWRWYSWEEAADDIMAGAPDRVVFVWDHPASPILTTDQLAAVGGFFFARDGVAVKIDPVVLRADQDPNPRLLAELSSPRAALIWAYDIGVQGTAARRFPPRLSRLDPTLKCRNYGRGSIGVLACERQGSLENRP